jgi:YD repeat-containing protein
MLVTISYVYDANDRLTQETATRGALLVNYGYNAAGEMTSRSESGMKRSRSAVFTGPHHERPRRRVRHGWF